MRRNTFVLKGFSEGNPCRSATRWENLYFDQRQNNKLEAFAQTHSNRVLYRKNQNVYFLLASSVYVSLLQYGKSTVDKPLYFNEVISVKIHLLPNGDNAKKGFQKSAGRTRGYWLRRAP